MTFEQVGIIGAGNIGIGVATDLLLHNINVVLVDLSDKNNDKAKSEILKNIRFAPLLLKNSPKLTGEEVLRHIKFTTHLEDVYDCDFIIENVTEDWSIKEQVYLRLDEICKPDVCFGVNTSCIPITKIGSVTNRPDNIVGVHLMNPVHLKKTVEVIRGIYTSSNTLEILEGLLNKLNKKSIIVNDFPGFVSNRISHLFMNEAAFVLQDKVAEATDIDGIFKECFGHSMGPLETADLIGIDTVVNSLDVLFESFQDSKFRVCPLLRQMVFAGKLGRKSGEGFYNYRSK